MAAVVLKRIKIGIVEFTTRQAGVSLIHKEGMREKMHVAAMGSNQWISIASIIITVM